MLETTPPCHCRRQLSPTSPTDRSEDEDALLNAIPSTFTSNATRNKLRNLRLSPIPTTGLVNSIDHRPATTIAFSFSFHFVPSLLNVATTRKLAAPGLLDSTLLFILYLSLLNAATTRKLAAPGLLGSTPFLFVANRRETTKGGGYFAHPPFADVHATRKIREIAGLTHLSHLFVHLHLSLNLLSNSLAIGFSILYGMTGLIHLQLEGHDRQHHRFAGSKAEMEEGRVVEVKVQILCV